MKKYTVLKGCGIAGTFHEPGDTVEVAVTQIGGLSHTNKDEKS